MRFMFSIASSLCALAGVVTSPKADPFINALLPAAIDVPYADPLGGSGVVAYTPELNKLNNKPLASADGEKCRNQFLVSSHA